MSRYIGVTRRRHLGPYRMHAVRISTLWGMRAKKFCIDVGHAIY
ncbi:hypothetical protein HMPREF1587_02031 [Bifidobacterium breve JCP7499]|nr:hypothetical protein HMPREF1587_02031 [Bifidobacterium breve JCP7499]